MKLVAVLLAGVSGLAIYGAAQAADLYIEDPAISVAMASSAHDWSGVYVGGSVGYGVGTVDWTSETYQDPEGILDDHHEGDFAIDGWTVGLQAGANVQFDMFVLGIEGDISWAGISGEGDEIHFEDDDVPHASIDWIGSIRGRAGVAIEQVLLYGTAGFAFAGGEFGVTNLAGDDRIADLSAMGWTAGIGAEVALDDNISIKGEYLYTSLSADEVTFDLPNDYYVKGNADIGIHTFKVGLNYSF